MIFRFGNIFHVIALKIFHDRKNFRKMRATLGTWGDDATGVIWVRGHAGGEMAGGGRMAGNEWRSGPQGAPDVVAARRWLGVDGWARHSGVRAREGAGVRVPG
jgi:hypothetical protein